jgi:hypothetical protein
MKVNVKWRKLCQARNEKSLGEDKANMLFCLSDGGRTQKTDLSRRRDVFGSAIGGA